MPKIPFKVGDVICDPVQKHYGIISSIAGENINCGWMNTPLGLNNKCLIIFPIKYNSNMRLYRNPKDNNNLEAINIIEKVLSRD